MDESPITPRTPRRSRYSLYQSDYETAAEDSDGSLYYSLLDDDEEKENDLEGKENHPISPRCGFSSQRSLLEKCLLKKNQNLTPRNEFNKRVSFNVNPVIPSTSLHFPTMALYGGLNGTRVLGTGNEVTKRSKNGESSNFADSSLSAENIADMFGSLNTSTGNDSDIVEVGEEEKSLNSTIIERDINAIETITEASEEATEEESQAVTSSSTSRINLKTINVPMGTTRIGLASSNQSISTNFVLSNLPVPKKVSIAVLADPLPTINNSQVPPSKRLSVFRGRSTESYGFAKPSGKSGIPKVSLMLARNNSVMHTSVLPSSSSQCKYCDKTFAKQSILEVHLLEKCEKIPPARFRQLQRQQSYPN